MLWVGWITALVSPDKASVDHTRKIMTQIYDDFKCSSSLLCWPKIEKLSCETSAWYGLTIPIKYRPDAYQKCLCQMRSWFRICTAVTKMKVYSTESSRQTKWSSLIFLKEWKYKRFLKGCDDFCSLRFCFSCVRAQHSDYAIVLRQRNENNLFRKKKDQKFTFSAIIWRKYISYVR